MSASRADLDRALWALRGYNITTLATSLPAGPHVAGVFFATVVEGDRIRLVLTVFRDTRLHRGIAADPHVAFMCSPGNASRWIQGTGRAPTVGARGRPTALPDHTAAHAPAPRPFIEAVTSVPVLPAVVELKIAEHLLPPPLLLDLGPPAEAA